MEDLITWEDKVNNPELLAFLEQYGETEYLTAVEINLVRDAINFLNSKRFPIKNDQKYPLVKGYGNTADTNEVGDLFMYWESSTKFVKIGRWEGGTIYTAIEWIEF